MARPQNTLPEIKRCGKLLTMHMGSEDILVNMEVEFIDNLSEDELKAVVDRVELGVKDAVPAVSKIFIEAQSLKKKTVKTKTWGE